jgi:hypothetical protein
LENLDLLLGKLQYSSSFSFSSRGKWNFNTNDFLFMLFIYLFFEYCKAFLASLSKFVCFIYTLENYIFFFLCNGVVNLQKKTKKRNIFIILYKNDMNNFSICFRRASTCFFQWWTFNSTKSTSYNRVRLSFWTGLAFCIMQHHTVGGETSNHICTWIGSIKERNFLSFSFIYPSSSPPDFLHSSPALSWILGIR